MESARIHIIEISVRVRFQARHVLMTAGRSVDAVKKILIIVRLAVVVLVVQHGDLIPAQHKYLAVAHAQAQRLEETGGKSSPGELAQLVVDAADQPDFAVKGAAGRV